MRQLPLYETLGSIETVGIENGALEVDVAVFRTYMGESRIVPSSFSHDASVSGGSGGIAPSSRTGLPGVTIFTGDGGLELAFSHHASDPLANEHAHDPFSVYSVLEHGGSTHDAVKAAADLGISFPTQQAAHTGSMSQGKEPRKSQATELVELVTASGAELFHNPDDEPYITVTVAEHKETYRLKSKAAKAWLRRLYRIESGKSVGGQALQDALNDLEGAALFDGGTYDVHVRLAAHQGDIILDLGDATHRVVRVTPLGWFIEADSPVKFVRPRALAALPIPVAGGDLNELWGLLNVAPEDRVLVAAWLAKALTPKGPYPILPLHGEQGSAKSTTARAIRALIDPSTAPLRSAPRNPHDLMIAATSSWVPTFDNLSSISQELSDALCVLSTGGGHAVRTLYTDDEETILSAQRPVIMTAISDIATRSDLLDRCIVLYLPRIKGTARQSEGAFWARFDRAHERILGALLSAVSAGLARYADVHLTELPCMADFAVWAVACEEGLGFAPETFLKRYGESRRDANALALDTSPLPLVLSAFTEAHGGHWRGGASDLLTALSAHLEAARDERTLKSRDWPKRADKLSGLLRRYAPNLRATGLEVEFERTSKQRFITLRLEETSSVTGVTTPDDSAEKRDEQTLQGDAKGDARGTWPVINHPAAGTPRSPAGDTYDAADAPKPSVSNWVVEL